MSQAIAIGAGVCAGITGLGLVIGGITTLALIPVYIKLGSDNNNNNGVTLNSIIGNNRTLSSHTSAIIAFAVMKGLLASGSRNGEIIIWNASTWEPKFPKNEISVNGEINGLAFVGSFSLAAISSTDGLNYWDIETAENKLTFKNNNYGIMNYLLFNQKRSELIISTSRGQILIFNLFGELTRRFATLGTVNSLEQLSNGYILVQSSDSIRYYTNTDYSLTKIQTIQTGMDAFKVIEPTKGINESLVYSFQSSMAVVDPNTENLLKTIISTDNVLFISQIETGLLVTSLINSVYFYNLADGLAVNSIKDIPGEVTSMTVNGTDVILGTNLNLIIILENKNVSNDASQPEPEEPKLEKYFINSHSEEITSLDINLNDLIVSGSQDSSIAFINKSTIQVLRKLQYNDPIVYVKFVDAQVLAVTSKGNLSYIDSNTYGIENSVVFSETVISALLFQNTILVGTQTGSIQVFAKEGLVKIKDFQASNSPISLIANLERQLFATSSENEFTIWNSDFNEVKSSLTTQSQTIALFSISNRNLVTVDRQGQFIIWTDQTYTPLSDSSLTGLSNLVNSAILASETIFVSNRESIIEYDLFNQIEVDLIPITVQITEIIIDNFQRPIVGTKNGSIVVLMTQILTPETKSTKQNMVTSTVDSQILTSLAANSSIANNSTELITIGNETTRPFTQTINQTKTEANQTTLNALNTFNQTVSVNFNQTSAKIDNETFITSFLTTIDTKNTNILNATNSSIVVQNLTDFINSNQILTTNNSTTV